MTVLRFLDPSIGWDIGGWVCCLAWHILHFFVVRDDRLASYWPAPPSLIFIFFKLDISFSKRGRIWLDCLNADLCTRVKTLFFLLPLPWPTFWFFMLQRGKAVQNCDGSCLCDFHFTRIRLALDGGGGCGVCNNFTICDFTILGSFVFVWYTTDVCREVKTKDGDYDWWGPP